MNFPTRIVSAMALAAAALVSAPSAQAAQGDAPASASCAGRPVPGANARVDEIAIANLMAEYVFRLDAHDFEGYGCLFEHGAFLAPNGAVLASGAKAVEALVRNTRWPADLVVRHLVWNSQIVVDRGGRTARAKSFFVTVRAMPGQEPYILRIATYNDRFEKAKAGWRFVSRSEESAWVKP